MISCDTKKFIKYMRKDKLALVKDAPESAEKAFREFNKSYKQMEKDKKEDLPEEKPNYSIDDYKDRLDSPLGCKLIEPPYSKRKTTKKKKIAKNIKVVSAKQGTAYNASKGYQPVYIEVSEENKEKYRNMLIED